MPAGTTPVLELESLFVRIWADATQYFDTVKKVQQQTFQMTKMLNDTKFGGAVAAIKEVTAAVQELGTAIGRIGSVRVATTGRTAAAVSATAAGAAASRVTGINQSATGLGSAFGMPNTLISAGNFLSNVGAVSAALVGPFQSALRYVSSSLSNFTNWLNSAGHSMNRLRLGIYAFGGLSIAFFAKFDDALTRTMANMRDWQQASRPMMESAIFDISSRSRTGIDDLARGMNAFTSAGMNAAMGIHALGIAETFAVASGMNLADASQKLMDIQLSLGMASENTATHMKNLTEISNLLAATAPMVGSTVEQLTNAMGNRFTVAMQNANMSLRDGIALLGLYSLRGIRGEQANDRASRMLVELSTRSTDNYLRWRALGIEVYRTGGHMQTMGNILSTLDNRFGKMSYQQRVVSLHMMGFEHRAVAAIMPLIGMSGAMRELTKEFGSMDNVMNNMAKMMRESFAGQLARLWNNLRNIAEVVGKHLAPMIGWLATKIESLSKWFVSLNPAMQHLIVIAGLLAAAALPLSLAFGIFASTLGSVLSILGMFFSLKGILFTIMGLLVAVNLDFQALWKTISGGMGLDQLVKNLAGFFWNFKENIGPLMKWFSENWRTILYDAVIGIGMVLKNVGFSIWEWLKYGFKYALGWIETKLQVLMVNTTAMARNFGAMWAGAISGALAATEEGEKLVEAKTNLKLALIELERLKALTTIKIPLIGREDSRGRQAFGPLELAQMTYQTERMGNLTAIWEPFAKDIKALFGPVVKLLPELNLSIPKAIKDPFASIEKWMRRFYQPMTGEGEGMGFSRTGPGFEFKQVSLQRYLVGGPASELLDYQQLAAINITNDRLLEIRNTLFRIADAKPLPAMGR